MTISEREFWQGMRRELMRLEKAATDKASKDAYKAMRRLVERRYEPTSAPRHTPSRTTD